MYVLLLLYRCPLDVPWMFYVCSMDVLLMLYGCSIVVLGISMVPLLGLYAFLLYDLLMLYGVPLFSLDGSMEFIWSFYGFY